ncbi:uncharacterized protein LOC141710919 [Apium graveolens]|uniref:uncharacterized protein LOC141710919 n=1 Tax=Apium graveolens TaxID=4045 RepID=UPI003D79564E
MKVSDIQKVDEHYIQKIVSCQVSVKKFDEKKNWYSPFCISCEKDLHEVACLYWCCGRTFEYPDIRFRLYNLCFDESGMIPIVWPDHEISRLAGFGCAADPAYTQSV